MQIWMQIQCALIASALISSGNTSTLLLPWCPALSAVYFSQPASHHIASRLKQTRWTQRVSQRSTLTVGSRLERECHALFVPQAQSTIAWSSSIQIETTSGSRLGECAFSANMPLVAAAHAETTDQRLPRPTTVPLLHSVYSVCPRLTQ